MPKHADDVIKELEDVPLPTASMPLPTSRDPSSTGPAIDVSTGDLPQISSEAWLALQQANSPPVLFHHLTGLVWIQRTPEDIPIVRTLDHDRLRHRLARVASFFRYNRKGDMVNVYPPSPVVRDLLASPNPPLPVLKHLVAAPYVTANDTLHLEPGYSPVSRLYYEPTGVLELPPIPTNPTVEQVREAVRFMHEPLQDFPFVGQPERAHALAHMIVPFMLEQIRGPIPALAIDKPLRGSGAGLLTNVILWPALGRESPKMTEPSDEAEWARTITAKLRNGSPVVVIDNVQQRLASPALMAAITEAIREDRVVRTSMVEQMAARRVWIITGINLQMSDEMIRRVNRCRLDPRVERPELRADFGILDLRAWLEHHRGRQVYAILTACQAWIVAGKSLSTKRLGGFEHYAQVMGGVLEFCEIAGFLENRDDVTDFDEQVWSDLFDVWHERFGNVVVGVSTIWDLLQVQPDLLIALNLGSKGEASQRSTLGLRLRERRDRLINGRRLKLAGRTHGANRWFLESL